MFEMLLSLYIIGSVMKCRREKNIFLILSDPIITAYFTVQHIQVSKKKDRSLTLHLHKGFISIIRHLFSYSMAGMPAQSIWCGCALSICEKAFVFTISPMMIIAYIIHRSILCVC